MELDEVVVVVVAVAAAAAPDAGRDKAPDGWAVQPQGQAATVSARRAGIMNRILSGCPAPAGLALNVAQR